MKCIYPMARPTNSSLSFVPKGQRRRRRRQTDRWRGLAGGHTSQARYGGETGMLALLSSAQLRFLHGCVRREGGSVCQSLPPLPSLYGRRDGRFLTVRCVNVGAKVDSLASDVVSKIPSSLGAKQSHTRHTERGGSLPDGRTLHPIEPAAQPKPTTDRRGARIGFGEGILSCGCVDVQHK